MSGSRSWGEWGWSWSIGLAVVVLLAMAVLEFVRPGRGDPVELRDGRPVSGLSFESPRHTEDVELYRLLPDASADLGRRVIVAGTVIGRSAEFGFWVRDLRDNIIFIADDSSGPTGRIRRGQSVRARGVIALFPPAEQDARFRAAGLVLPSGATIVREVRISALEGEIEVLND